MSVVIITKYIIMCVRPGWCSSRRVCHHESIHGCCVECNAGVCLGDILPSDSPMLRPLLTEEMASDADQLQQTASLLRKQRDELQQKMKRSQVSRLIDIQMMLICLLPV